MPTWCNNKLRFIAEDNIITQIQNLLGTNFDLNKLIPLPDDLLPEKYPNGLTENISADLIIKYGCDNWYDWKLKNWGTLKINEVKIVKSNNYIEYNFLSSWDAPIKWLNKLKYMFSFEEIYLEYFNINNDTGGIIVYNNSQISTNLSYKLSTRNWSLIKDQMEIIIKDYMKTHSKINIHIIKNMYIHRFNNKHLININKFIIQFAKSLNNNDNLVSIIFNNNGKKKRNIIM